MEWIYTTASTVAEAETKALDLLGVDPDDAEIQVMEEGKTGLFGRVKAEARVRARIKPKAPPDKDERRQGRGEGRNRGRNRGKSGGGGGRSGDGRNRKRDDRKDRGDSDGGKGGKKEGAKATDKGRRDGAKAEAKSSSDGGSGDGRKRRRRSGGGSGGDNAGKASSSGGGGGGGGGRRRDKGRGDDRSSEDRVEMPIDEQRETLHAFVAGVATTFDPDAKVELVVEDTTLSARVTGQDLGRLIGNKAQTLQTLEELARTAMHRAADGRRYHRIQVDVDNYRGRRREALVEFATDLAESVADSGVSKAMEPMGAADRKLVHDAVAQVAGVETVSEGRDPRRYIVILPVGGDASDEEE